VSSRNVDKGREAENAVATFLQGVGFPHAERRSKRGGTVQVECPACRGAGSYPVIYSEGVLRSACGECDDGMATVPADAGDLTGIPGVVIQVKWSGYKPLAEDMRRTEEQRRAGRADVGLLVRKRKAVGMARAGEWDAYLPQWALPWLLVESRHYPSPPDTTDTAVWHTDLATAARLIARAGYGARTLENAL